MRIRRDDGHYGHPLVRWMDDALRDTGLTDRYVLARAGLATNTLSTWRRRGHRPRVDLLDAALEVLGYRLAIVDADTGEVMGP